MRTRVFLLALSMASAFHPASCQANYAVITGSNLTDSGGIMLVSGQLCFAPVDAHGNAIGVKAGGQLTKKSVCSNVVNGIITPNAGTTFALANTQTTYPSPICYKATLTDNSNGESLYSDASYSCVQMSSTWCSTVNGFYTCNWDNYPPNSVAQAPITSPTLAIGSITTGAPNVSLTGTPPNYLLNFTLPPNSNGVTTGNATAIPYYASSGSTLSPAPGVTTDGNGNLSVNGQTSTNNILASSGTVLNLNSTTANIATANATALNATIATISNNLTSPVGNIDSVISRYVSASQSVTSPWIQGKLNGSTYHVDQFGAGTFDQLINSCMTYGAIYGQTSLTGATGNFICDARRLTGSSNGSNTLTAGANITIPNTGVTVLLPCGSVNFGNYQLIIPSTVSDVDFEGCGQGVTWLNYSGSGIFVQVGDPSFASNTTRIKFKHLSINTNTGGTAVTAMAFYRTQDIEMDDVELNGNGTGTNAQQTGILLDGTGNYTGGTFRSVHLNSYYTGLYMGGHDSGSVVGDYANASIFERLHIDCPTQVSGAPLTGTTGIALIKGDGNTFIGGDVEGCDTMTHLGAWALNNSIFGLRNENSNTQFLADLGSSFNNVMTGGTFFTGQLKDYGSRNSFWDAFHRDTNGITGDWYASQQDGTVTNHLRVGTGAGNERGLLNELQTDFGYRWIWGFSDGAGGQQLYQVQDVLNNVNRLSIGQYLSSSYGAVTAINVTNGGCYYAQPWITVTGGGGSGATASANVVSSGAPCNGYTVQSVTVTVQGSGYTTAPTITFAGGVLCSGCNASTITATATPVVSYGGSSNNVTALNSAGTGAVCLNCSSNSGTGGVTFNSGGSSPSLVGAIDGSGNQTLYGYLRWFANSVEQWRWDCAETTFCGLKNISATTPAWVFRGYQGGGTEIDSQGSGAVTVNNTSTSGTGGFIVYQGGTNYNTQALRVGSDGSVYIPAVKSNSGTRYVCINSSGQLVSQTTACSGT